MYRTSASDTAIAVVPAPRRPVVTEDAPAAERVLLQAFAGVDGADRYHRQKLLPWWDQDRIASARILVVGAGALGNEILKLLALTGVGHVVVYDMDHIERSNLSRAALFRDGDEGRPKASVAAERMIELNPDVRVTAHDTNLLHRAGLGVFAWADVVICGVDNREARIFVSSACARTGRRWVDGAIEGFSGVARVFDPVNGTCYECTMNATDRRLVDERRSCAMLARSMAARGHVPNTAIAASIVGALQVQEALKVLHGRPALDGEGIHFDGTTNQFDRVRYPRRDDCPGHDHLGEIVPLGHGVADRTVGELLDRACTELGEGTVLEFSRDLVIGLECPSCGAREAGGAVLGEITEAQAGCPACGTHRIVDLAACATERGPVDLSLTPAALGVPAFDVLVARNGLDARRAWLFDGDADAVLRGLPHGARAGEGAA